MKRTGIGLGEKCRKNWLYVKQHPAMYIMLFPGLLFVIVYKLLPLYGIQIAFRDYNIFLGDNPIDAIG